MCLYPSLPISKYTYSILWVLYFCLLKSSDCIYDIVCTKKDLWESSSLIGIKDRGGGLVHPSNHISKCMRVAKTTIRHFVNHEGLLPNSFQKILTSTLTYIFDNNVIEHFKCTAHPSCTVRSLTKRYIRIRLHHETKSQQIKSSDLIRSKLNRLVIFSHV